MKIKNLLIGAALIAAASTAFAENYDDGTTNANYASVIRSIPSPTSNKKFATSGRFSTDIDNFMDVNDWSGIKPKKFFSFLGYDYGNDMGSNFNMGFAKYMNKNTYVGMYFGGQLDGMKMTSVFSDDTDVEPNSYAYESTSENSFTTSVLIGTKGGLGIKTSIFYKPNDTTQSTYSRPNMDKDPFEQVDLFELWGDVSVGLGDKKSTHFNIGLDANVAKATTDGGFIDNSYYDLYIGAGMTTEKTGWDLDLDTRWRITPVTYKHVGGYDYDHFGYSDNIVRFTAAKGFTCEATKNLTLKAKFKLPLSLGVKSTDDDAARVDGEDWIYSTTRTHYTNLGLTPSLNLGAVWKAVPNKVDINVGTGINLGRIGWDFVTVSNRDKTDSASIDNSNCTVSFGFDSSALNISWRSGFTCYFGKYVTLDAYYNIIGNLFDGLSSNDITFNRNNDILETLNKMVIPASGLSFVLTLKM